MNERLKEFEKTSGLEIFGLGARREIWERALEKYAELVVQDCIDIISPYTVRMNNPGEECLHPIQEIKKNFKL